MQGQAVRGYLLEKTVLFACVEECQEDIDGRKHNHVDRLIVYLIAVVDVSEGNGCCKYGSPRVTYAKKWKYVEYSEVIHPVQFGWEYLEGE